MVGLLLPALLEECGGIIHRGLLEAVVKDRMECLKAVAGGGRGFAKHVFNMTGPGHIDLTKIAFPATGP